MFNCNTGRRVHFSSNTFQTLAIPYYHAAPKHSIIFTHAYRLPNIPNTRTFKHSNIQTFEHFSHLPFLQNVQEQALKVLLPFARQLLDGPLIEAMPLLHDRHLVAEKLCLAQFVRREED